MKTFTEWLKEAAGIPVGCDQFVQGDKPNYAGSGSNQGCSPQEARAGKCKPKKHAGKNEGIVVGAQPPGVGVQGGKSDFVIAGAPGVAKPKRRKKRRTKRKKA